MTLRNRMLRAAAGAGAAPPVATDPQFNYVSLLLNDTGTNGQQNNTFLDSSSNNFTITRNGTPTQGSVTPYWPNGQWSNYFNGTTDFLTVPTSTAFDQSGNFTIESWIYLTAAPASGTTIGGAIYSQESPATRLLKLSVYNNLKVAVTQAGVGQVFTSTQTLSLNTWYHVALVKNGSGTNNIKLYINGVNDGSGTKTDPGVSTTTSYIGREAYTGTGTIYFPGYMSNWRFVKGTALYTANFTPSTTPLTAVSGTSLLTCQSNRFKDNSSNNFAITVTGTPTVQAFEPFEPASSYATSVGGSGYFSGSSQFLTAPNNTAFDFGSGNFTIESWVYLTSNSPAEQILFGKRANNAVYAPILAGFSKSGTVYRSFYLGSFNGSSWGLNGSFVKGAIDIPLNTWVHVAYVRNGSTFTSYVNGVADLTFTGLSSALMTNTDAVSICSSATAADSLLFGYASNLRIVKGTAVYTANFTPPTSPVTAITGTSLLLNCTNAGIYDAATLNDLVTVGNAQVSTAQAKFGSSSMYFDGSGDGLFFPSALSELSTGNFTVECWYYTGSATNQTLFAIQSNTIAYSAVRLDHEGATSKLYMLISSNGSLWAVNVGSTNTVSPNTWTHVAVVRSGSTFTLYINGLSSGTGSTSSSLMNSTLSYVGGHNNGGSIVQNVNGYIEDLRITKGYARYTANFTPPTAPFPTR